YVPDKTVAELSPRWAVAPSQFMTVDGQQVHIRDEGLKSDPVPIVLLHGTSASLHTWQVLNKMMEYTLPRNMVEASVRNVYADPNKVSSELVDRYYDLTLREGNRQALVDRFKQISANDSEKVKQLTMPTLILWGKQDQLIPVEYAQHFQQDIKGSQLVVFDNLGHVPHEEDPQQTVSAVMKFLAL
ncbi:MAG TPA: alpha/beta hydrolase, partial [Agitococcus sp.]|nr:alpha/beta hydrolase [Agitococcus sp.]